MSLYAPREHNVCGIFYALVVGTYRKVICLIFSWKIFFMLQDSFVDNGRELDDRISDTPHAFHCSR